MPYVLNEHYQIVVVKISGKFLGSLEGEALRRDLQEEIEAGRTNVVFDLSETDFMDSSGIGTLIKGAEMARVAGGDACLAGLQERIRGPLLMTRLLGPVFESYDDVEAAAQHFEKRPAPAK